MEWPVGVAPETIPHAKRTTGMVKGALGALLGVGFVLSMVPALAAAPVARTAPVLDALRSATLSRPLSSITSIHSSGNSVIVGIRCSADEYDDVRGTRFTATLNGGPLTGASGWDGSRAWSQDYSGLVHVDGGASGRLQAIDQAYFDNFQYLRPDLGGATASYTGSKSQSGRQYDVLTITPPHGSAVNLWIDTRTHLIARQIATFGIITVTTSLSDYRKVDGLTYPFHVASQSSTGNSSTTTVNAVRLNEDITPQLAVPQSSVHDFSISSGDSTTVPLQIVNNHLYLQGMVNGHGPYTFILDSGGDYIITPEVAKALSAKSAGGMQLGGVGNKTEGASLARVDSISIGNATVRNQYMLVLPIGTGFGMAEGMHIDGMIGFQLLARFLTTIDYAGSKITFAMPEASSSPGGAAALSFYFDDTIPRIPITVDSVTTSGEVDTGSRGSLTLSAPFVSAHPALAALAKTPPGVDGFGVGGPAYARLGRVHALQIGPFTLNDAIAAFAAQQKGAFADPFNPANLGGAVWRRFTVTFDYPHQQMLLAKNAEFNAPFSYDRSGIFLIDNNGAHTVISVMPGTPAAQSGIAKGDVIVSVNGVPASNVPLAQLRTQLSGPAGTVVRLGVRNAAGERTVPLTLRDYV
jgi:hypothetical protein